MNLESFSRSPEVEKKRYAEEIYESLPDIETGVEIPKVSVSRLTSGKDSVLNISVKERLSREGWDLDDLNKTRTGGVVMNRTGETFEVLEIKKGIIKIKNSETGLEGEIVAQPRVLKVHEYDYNLRDNFRNSRKIKVFDAAYRDRSLDTTEFIDAAVGSIPAWCMDVFDEIEIHSQRSGKAGAFRAEPSLFSDRRVLTLYVDEEGYSEKMARETIYHELGHAIVKYLRGTTNPGEAWKKLMRLDGAEVSEYASKTKYPKEGDDGEIEDIADAIMIYLATDGAKSPQTQSLRDMLNNRFGKLDEVFIELSERQKAGFVSGIKQKLLKTKSSLEK